MYLNNDLLEKEKNAIKILKTFAPKTEPYYLCYSGGKDSDVIRILAELSGVQYESHHNLTTVDAPETMQYIRSVPGVIIDKSHYEDGTPITMWNLIVKKRMPPTRKVRYCCETLKENGGEGRLKITGVRWEESTARYEGSDTVIITKKPKKAIKVAKEFGAKFSTNKWGGVVLSGDNTENRRVVEHCYRNQNTRINPIVDWTTQNVWTFLRHYGCAANPLYQCGEKRVGCLLCSLPGPNNMKMDAKKYPKYKELYIHAFDRMLLKREQDGLPMREWKTGEDVYNWWVGINPDQMVLDGFEV